MAKRQFERQDSQESFGDAAGEMQGNGGGGPRESAEMDVLTWLRGLSHQDQITIERTSPIERRGYLTALVWDPSLDLQEEIRRSYGGGSYLVKARRRAQNGSLLWLKGSFRIEIAGEPRSASQEQAQCTQPIASTVGQGDLQAKLLDILSSQLGSAQRSGDIPGIVAQIIDVVGGRPAAAAVDPMQQLLAAAEAGKKLAGLFQPPPPRQPPPSSEPANPIESMMMMMMMKMMGGGEPQRAAMPPPLPPPPPVGAVWDGRQWRVPPRPPQPDPQVQPQPQPQPDSDPTVPAGGDPLSPEELADEVLELDPDELQRFLSKAMPGVDLAAIMAKIRE